LKLEWFVFREDPNNKKIKVFNIFDHSLFLADVKKALKTKKTKEDFEERVRIDLFYYFGSKCEHEIVVTSWPPYITTDELDRLNEEREERRNEYGKDPYSMFVSLNVSTKIDIYEQVRMNWCVFLDYLWSHKK
jgi:hypothetical protein